MPTQSTDAWFQRNWTSETDSFSGGDRHQITLWSGRVPCDSNPPNGHNTKRLEQSNQSATEPPLVTPEIPYIYIQGIAWGPASRRIDQNIKRAQARVVRSTSTSCCPGSVSGGAKKAVCQWLFPFGARSQSCAAQFLDFLSFSRTLSPFLVIFRALPRRRELFLRCCGC